MLSDEKGEALLANNIVKIHVNSQKEQKYINTSAFFSAITTLLLHFSLGICQGFSAVLLPQLQSSSSELPITRDDESWIASVSVISMPAGALFGGIFMEIYGRKKIIQVAFIPLAIGWAILGTANSVLILCIGRLITGFAIGMDPAVIIYIAETNLPKFRSTLLALTGPAIVLGTLFSYLLGYLLFWRTAAIVLCAFSGLCFFLFFIIPESPVWLVAHNNIDGATESLKWLRNDTANISAEIDELLQAKKLSKASANEKSSYIQKIIATKAWKPFLILSSYFFLQQFTGCNIIFYYAVNFYEAFGTPLSGFLSSLVFISLCLLFSFVFIVAANKVTRKTLTMVSSAGICVACALAAIYEYVLEGVESKPMFWFPLVCMWVNVAIGVTGIYSLPWLMAGELFPTEVRGLMTGLMWLTVYMFIFVAVKLYPLLVSVIHIQGVLGMFSMSAFLLVLFGKFVLPETRGKTLAEIEQLW